MSLVKFGKKYINPQQVIHVGEYLDGDNEPIVIIHMVDNCRVETRLSLIEVVTRIDSGL